MALDLLDVIKRYNEAKANEDDMIKDIELQKIQAEFLANNEFINSAEKTIQDKEDEIAALKVDVERLRDANAQLRIQQGSHVEQETKEEVVEEVVEEQPKTLSELAKGF